MKNEIKPLQNQIKGIVAFFMTALIVSGATAIPVEWELSTFLPSGPPQGTISFLLHQVLTALRETNSKYPYLMYGYDWLAFAHFVIAIAFIGVFRQPVRNIWVVEFGMIACLLVIPFAFIFAPLRGLPLWWCFVDSSFGVFGAIALWWLRSKIQGLAKLQTEDQWNILF